jgi:hypothetical protein
MIQMLKIATATAGFSLVAGAALAASPPAALPTLGHYIGYNTVVAQSGCPASQTVGESFQTQLELDTPVSSTLVVKVRRVYPGDAPGYVPGVFLRQYEKTGMVHLAPAGNVTITDERTGKKIVGKFVATYKALDLNSFGASVTVTYPFTPAGGKAGTCIETTESAYIRSSAD